MSLRVAFAAVCLVAIGLAADFDSRLTVHTILREDLFAGFLDDDLRRLADGEQKIERLLAERPEARGSLLAWKGSADLYRAARAQEANQSSEYERYYAAACRSFDEAEKVGGGKEGGVRAIIGASFALQADRLAPKHRLTAWARSYENYRQLMRAQEAILDKLPLHHKGELLAGLAQSAQRTGRIDESAQYIDRMLMVLARTPYEPFARKWKSDAAFASRTSLVCKTCHEPGRLSAKTAALAAQ